MHTGIYGIYMVMLEIDTIHSEEIASIYENHLSILGNILGTVKNLHSQYIQLFGVGAQAHQYLGTDYAQFLKQRLLISSIDYLLHTDLIRFEKTYNGREVDRQLNYIPNLKGNGKEYQTPYQVFLPYMLFWAKVVLTVYPPQQVYQCLPLNVANIVMGIAKEYPDIIRSITPQKIKHKDQTIPPSKNYPPNLSKFTQPQKSTKKSFKISKLFMFFFIFLICFCIFLSKEDDGDNAQCNGNDRQVRTDAFKSFDGCGNRDSRSDDSICQQGAGADNGQ